ncbi:serine protease [Dietzia sp. 179-F 9C3 NHS]|uniref:serine protease n=1 Tax=Dietzia sp. 179-F 9C3 NHS TaxID=3374295 RepID=UPI0038796467
MRTTRSLAALAATAALVVTAGPVGAAPAPQEPTGPTATAPTAPGTTPGAAAIPALTDVFGPAAAAQLTSLVEALRRDLGLTPEQFLDQAGVGARLAESQPRWEQLFRDSFGGVWLDEDGTGLVGVAPGTDADELRSEATEAGFTVQDVALTASELAARERQVTKIVEGLPEELGELVTNVRTDPTRNAVVVTTRGGDQAQLGNLTARLKNLAEIDMVEAPTPAEDTAPFGSQGGPGTGGPTLQGLDPGSADDEGGAADPEATAGSLGSLTLLNQLGVVPEGPLQTVVDLLAGLTPGTGSIIDGMNELVPNPTPSEQRTTRAPAETGPVVGGTAYEVPVPGGLLECSTGFNGELDGKPVVITAAHCAGADGTRASFPGGDEFGTMTDVRKEGIDTALIRIDDEHVDRFRTNLVGTGPDTTQAITGTTAPVVGQKACKSGSRTGFSCGTISEVGATIDVAGSRTIEDAFTVDLCALPGDSGGVVFSGDKALGVSSASNVAETGNCANAEKVAAANGFTPRLSVVPIDDVLAAHPGLSLRTS